jgi:aryl-alcohol dehydrogenase-like predicted oxidoreductase
MSETVYQVDWNDKKEGWMSRTVTPEEFRLSEITFWLDHYYRAGTITYWKVYKINGEQCRVFAESN